MGLAMKLMLVIVLLCGAALGADRPKHDVHALLRGAVLCEGNPFDTVRNLTKHGSANWNDGYAGEDFGEDMSYANVLVLKKPLVIEGASTSAVIGDLEGSYSDFTGLVYGRFRGDYKKVVTSLGLERGGKSGVGTYSRSLNVGLDGEVGAVCSKTIGLTPKEGDEFLLGCGWCNG